LPASTIGIDLGTTNTVGAIDGRAMAIRSEMGSAILPSVVAFLPTGSQAVGTSARRRRAIDARNTIYSAKRLIGRAWYSAECEEMRRRYAFELVEGEAGGAAFKTRAGVFPPAQIGALVMESLVEQSGLEATDTRAVIAVPSGFSDSSRRETLRAAELAGFAETALIEEPVATAHAYAGSNLTGIRHAFVYDLGGGTFEAAVVDWTSQPPRVLAKRGDLYLGGDDIDHALASWVADEVLRLRRWDLRDDPLVHDRLILECERAKIRLCYAGQAAVDMAQVDSAIPGEAPVAIAHDQLEGLTEFLVRRTFIICDEVLAAAELKANQIDAVFLAGGTTQLPMLRRAVARYFGSEPRTAIDPMEVVGIGASLWQP